MKRNLALLATAAALALSGLSAHAGCVDPRVAVQNAANRMPLVLPAAARAAAGDDHHDNDSIVGTWVVNYTSGGNPAGDAFIQWHDDGTEWENIDFPAASGNKDLAEDWIAAFTANSQMKVIVKAGNLPNSTALLNLVTGTPGKQLAQAARVTWFVPTAKNWTNVERGNVLQNMLSQILTGKKSVKDAAVAASNQITTTLNAAA